MFFNAGCNEQVFSPKSWKKFCADPAFQEKHVPIPKKITLPSQRQGYSN